MCLTNIMNDSLKNKTFLDILRNTQLGVIRKIIEETGKITDLSAYFQIFHR